jgi:hypothetical protein
MLETLIKLWCGVGLRRIVAIFTGMCGSYFWELEGLTPSVLLLALKTMTIFVF